MNLSLSEQITALEGMTTNSPTQGDAKQDILATLRKLANVREHFMQKHLDENAVVQLMVEVLTEEPS